MTKRERQIGAVFVTLAVIWALMHVPKWIQDKFLSKKVPARSSGTAPTVSGSAFQPMDYEDLIVMIKLKSIQIDFSEVKDPFQKPKLELAASRAALELSDLVLTGIIFEQEEPLVLINDQILKKDDKIAGFTIKEIRRHEVVLMRGLEKYTLKLFAETQEEE